MIYLNCIFKFEQHIQDKKYERKKVIFALL